MFHQDLVTIATQTLFFIAEVNLKPFPTFLKQALNQASNRIFITVLEKSNYRISLKKVRVAAQSPTNVNKAFSNNVTFNGTLV